ncbi:MAG: DUF1727 domain-containing protein [Coriobacteriales bacterium]|nr:DUF1727 domain-containing protein [Coriobacteriales bacterium]
MGLRFACAKGTGALLTGVLKTLGKQAATLPGKMSLRIDPDLIAHLRPRIKNGTLAVVGTNGKTTVTNLIAQVFEAAGYTVACNKTGANLNSGIASALLHSKEADWGIFECDELWLAKVLPQLGCSYVLLLNLFRDQLDRMGEIDHIQASIAQALEASPSTVLIYNADDPLCQAIANRVHNELIPFGIEQNLAISQNTTVDAKMCQQCDSMLTYTWHQYGQLGKYRCPACGFSRTEPQFAAHNVTFSAHKTTFSIHHGAQTDKISTNLAGTYMVYNILAAYTVCTCCDIPSVTFKQAESIFNPKNGRLQNYVIDGQHILLNLAKNPTGFNENLKIIRQDTNNKAIAFFINDQTADGHDVSWLWDVDFQELAGDAGTTVFSGGMRKYDMQVRLKYAGIASPIIHDVADFLAQAQAVAPGASYYIIANYTALPDVKAALDSMEHLPTPKQPAEQVNSFGPFETPALSARQRRLTIVHMYPDLLNLYGDSGNVTILAQRARAREIDVDVVRVNHGAKADLTQADIVFLGGGPDREQYLASQDLLEQAQALKAYIEDDGVLLAICGGYQIIGREWLLDNKPVPGLGLIDAVTQRAQGGTYNRLVNNIVLKSSLAHMPVVGFENHAGRTYLGEGCWPFGTIVDSCGHGNNDTDSADGIIYRNLIGTYLHGPLLSKNPEIADYLIEQALRRQASKECRETPPLPPLDNSAEETANRFMLHKLGIQ